MSSSSAPLTAIDPICGMTVVVAKARATAGHRGVTYHFCSTGCQQRFIADPDGSLARRPDSAARRAAPGALVTTRSKVTRAGSPPAAEGFTCPMHPDVVTSAPGDCPICGMALEPIAVDAGAPDSRELTDMSRRLWISVACVAPLVGIAMIGMPTDSAAHGVWSPRLRAWIECALATPVCLWAAWPFYVRAAASVRLRRLNMFTLIGLGVAAAFGYSLAAVVAPGVFPPEFRTTAGDVPVYFESAAAIVALVLVGQVLELGARRRTGAAIRSLLAMSPAVAHRVRSSGGGDEDVPLSAVREGDRLRVRPGERVPADGVVVEGGTTIDESMMTGEPVPVHKQPDDRVVGSTLNGTGSVVMRADRVGPEMMVSRIVALVAAAQRSRAPIQSVADRSSALFVPAVVVVAVATFVVWAWIGPEPRFAHALVNAVAVLIVACPCALGLATPMAIVVAMGRGATGGVLFRSADALERLGAVDTLVLDKTGTLTVGKPTLATVSWHEGFSEVDVLRLAASVEIASEHPLSGAIVRGAAARGVELEPTEGFVSTTGRGVSGRVGGRAVLVGNAGLLHDRRIDLGPLVARAEVLRADGHTVVFVAVDGRPAGLLGITDPLKASAPDAVRALHAAGLRLVLLTGDTLTTARAVARRLGIDDVRADLMPADKAAVITRMQADGHRVAMAGDGVNDAPALAAADVGIAMGHGTDVAIDAAAVTLVRGDLGGLIRARQLSRETMANIRQNLFFAFVYNALGVPIAAGALYPFFGVLLSPVVAAAAMSLSSVSVIANALRLRARG